MPQQEAIIDVATEIAKYQSFLVKLQGDHSHARSLLVEAQRKLDVLKNLAEDIEDLQKSSDKELRLLKDAGCGVHVTVRVPDTSRIFVSVGLGFFAEATLAEARRISDARAAAIRPTIEARELEVAKIEAHIELIGDGLSGLRGLAHADG